MAIAPMLKTVRMRIQPELEKLSKRAIGRASLAIASALLLKEWQPKHIRALGTEATADRAGCDQTSSDMPRRRRFIADL